MGEIVMWNLITLDGYFEGTKKWNLDFHNQVWGDELERLSIEQLKLQLLNTQVLKNGGVILRYAFNANK